MPHFGPLEKLFSYKLFFVSFRILFVQMEKNSPDQTITAQRAFSQLTHLKGQSHENVCEIIALNDRLDSN
jgi:hypothetical protein